MNEKQEDIKFKLRCTALLFSMLCTIYFCYLSNHILSNHDYPFIKEGTILSSGLFEGRITQFIPPWLLTNQEILPIFNIILAFLFLTSGTVLLAGSLPLKPRYSTVLLFGALIAFHPFYLTHFYYTYLVLSFMTWFLICTIGLISAEKMLSSPNRKAFWGITAFFCYTMSFSGYIGTLELVLTLILSRLLFEILNTQSSLLSLIKRLSSHLGIMFAALGTYYALFIYFRAARKIIANMYNVQHNSLSEIIYAIIHEATTPWKMMFADFPYLSPTITLLPLLFIFFLLMIAFKRKKLTLTLICMPLFAYGAYALAYVALFGCFQTIRIHTFSVTLFLAVMYAVVAEFGSLPLRNIANLLAVILLVNYISADFYAEKIWLLGNAQDERAADRIRAELIPMVIPEKIYRLYTLGGLYGREKFANKTHLLEKHREQYRELFGFPHIYPSYAAPYLFLYEKDNPVVGTYVPAPAREMSFLSSGNAIVENPQYTRFFKKAHTATDLIAAVEKAKPYPDADSLFSGKSDILVMFGKDSAGKSKLLRKLWKKKD